MKPSGYVVTVLVDADLVEPFTRTAQRWLAGPLETDPADPAGRSRAQLDLDGPDHAVRTLVIYGAGVEVVTPDELRERVVAHAEAIVERYRA